jgi:hypothetical protein
MWMSISVSTLNHHIIRDAITVYIHGASKSRIDMTGFDSLRTIEVMELYRFCLVGVRQPTITIISYYLPVIINKEETKAISTKFINSHGIFKYCVKIRTVDLIQPIEPKHKILLR